MPPVISPSDIAPLHTEFGEDFEFPDGSVKKGIWGSINHRVSDVRASRFRAWFPTAEVGFLRVGSTIIRLRDHAVLHVNDITSTRFGQTRLDLVVRGT